MTPRAIRRAAMRKAEKLARKAAPKLTNTNTNNPMQSNTLNQPLADAQPTEETAADVLAAAFDFTDEEDDAISLNHQTNAHLAEKAFSAAAGASSSSGDNSESADTASHGEQKPPISDARRAANRKNSQEHSTGPRTTAGKLKVSLNAIKTGLTSQVVVLPNEDAAEYRKLLDRRFAKYSPVGDDENMLVQAIIDNEWRIARVAPLEASFYAIGLREFAGEFSDEADLTTRASLIRGKTALHYRRDLSNLALQERRLRNHIESDVAKLEALQKERYTRRKSEIQYCLKLKASEGPGFQTSDAGFDFSLAEFDAFLAHTATRFRLTGQRPDFDLFLAGFRVAKKEAQAA